MKKLVREILFRGKRKDDGKWVYGFYMKHINRTPAVVGDMVRDGDVEYIILYDGFSDWNLPRGIEYVHVDPESVGQFTGLVDKNGKQIFEGDVIRWDEKEFGCKHTEVVRWNYGLFDMRKIDWSEWCEVVGNIHDDPELLKEVDDVD